MANKTEWLNELEGFAKESFAQKRGQEVAEKCGNPDVTWFVYPLKSGRFIPVFIHRGDGFLNIMGIAAEGCAVMN